MKEGAAPAHVLSEASAQVGRRQPTNHLHLLTEQVRSRTPHVHDRRLTHTLVQEGDSIHPFYNTHPVRGRRFVHRSFGMFSFQKLSRKLHYNIAHVIED